MKKSNFLTAIVLMIIFPLIAQNENVLNGHKCKYYHAIEINGKLGTSSDIPWGIGVAEIHGIQFNQHLILGLGLGFDYYDNYYAGGDMDFFMFSSYLNFRYMMLKDRKWTPMLMCSFGYLGVYERYQHERQKHRGTWEHGFIVELYAGAKYQINSSKSLYTGIGFDLPIMAFSLKAGFQF